MDWSFWNSVLFVIKWTIEGSYVRCNGLALVCWCIEMLVDHVAYFERKAEEWERHGNTEVCAKSPGR